MSNQLRETSIEEALKIKEQVQSLVDESVNANAGHPLSIEIMDSKTTDSMNFNIPGLPKPPFRMLMNAQSNSGKTNLLMNLLSKRMYGGYFPTIHVFSNSLATDIGMWSNLPDERLRNCHDHYDEKKLAEIFDEQEQLVAMQFNGVKCKQNAVLVVCDDVIEDLFHFGSGPKHIADHLAIRGRHVNISFIIISQQYKLLPKTLRINCSAMILFELHNRRELKDVFEEHCGQFTAKRFEALTRHIWSLPYQFLFIDYTLPNVIRFRKNLTRAVVDEEMMQHMNMGKGI